MQLVSVIIVKISTSRNCATVQCSTDVSDDCAAFKLSNVQLCNNCAKIVQPQSIHVHWAGLKCLSLVGSSQLCFNFLDNICDINKYSLVAAAHSSGVVFKTSEETATTRPSSSGSTTTSTTPSTTSRGKRKIIVNLMDVYHCPKPGCLHREAESHKLIFQELTRLMGTARGFCYVGREGKAGNWATNR